MTQTVGFANSVIRGGVHHLGRMVGLPKGAGVYVIAGGFQPEDCGNHGTGAPRYCTTAPAYAFETSSGDTGLCGGGNGNTNWVRSEGHDYRGQSASYLYVCGYGPSVCPPNGYGGCGYADSALRGTEAESATTWGREGDGFVVRFYLR